MKHYEYRVEARPRTPDGNAMSGGNLEGWLNKYGEDGWELCALKEDKYGWSEIFFRRQMLNDLVPDPPEIPNEYRNLPAFNPESA